MSEGLKLSPSHVERSLEVKPHLKQYAERLKAMDKDGNGELDLAEVCEVLEEMATIEKQKRLLKWMAIISGIFALLSIAAIVGLTYAVVALSKDTSVSNGVMLTKDGAPLTMGTYRISGDLVIDDETWIEPAASRRRSLLQTQEEIDAYIDSNRGSTITGCWKNFARTLTDVKTFPPETTPGDNIDLKTAAERDMVGTCLALKNNGVRAPTYSLVESGCRGLCETAVVTVEANSHICDAILNTLRPPSEETKAATEASLCNNPSYPVEVDAEGKVFASWPIITGNMVDNEKNSKPVVVRLKANCYSITEPKFMNWYESGYLHVPKTCPTLTPPSPPVLSPAPAPEISEPTPSPSPAASPSPSAVVESPTPAPTPSPSPSPVDSSPAPSPSPAPEKSNSIVTAAVMPMPMSSPSNTNTETVVEAEVIKAGDK